MREQLEILRSQVVRRAELKENLGNLEAEKERLEKTLFALKIDAHNQQADVDTLNMFSLKNFYLDLTGKKEELLAKEISEARAAKEKYNTAIYQLDQNRRQIEVFYNELESLQGCETEYWQQLQEALSTAQGEEQEWVVHAMAERLDTVIGELHSVIESGNAALQLVDGVLNNIENVRDWNMNLAGTAWSMTMQGYLNGSQKKIEDFRKQLIIFRKKLNDLPIPSQVYENADEIFVFPENYLRELTSKFSADERLCEADSAVRAAERRLKNILFQVEQVLARKMQEQEALK